MPIVGSPKAGSFHVTDTRRSASSLSIVMPPARWAAISGAGSRSTGRVVRLPGGGPGRQRNFHAGKILSAIELRSRITLELQPEARNLTINNYLVRDAAELVNTLRDNPEAVTKIEEWYAARMDAKLIEHEAA